MIIENGWALDQQKLNLSHPLINRQNLQRTVPQKLIRRVCLLLASHKGTRPHQVSLILKLRTQTTSINFAIGQHPQQLTAFHYLEPEGATKLKKLEDRKPVKTQ